MKVIMNYEIDQKMWDTLIAHSRFTNPFQIPSFYNIINSIQGYSAEAVAIEDQKRILALVVVVIQKENGLKAYFSRRGIIYGGPLYSPDRPEALTYLVKSINSILGQKTIYLETRNLFDYTSEKSVFKEFGWNYIPYVNYQIHLQGRDLPSILSGMHYNRRREIRMSLEEGARYEECSNEVDVKAFYTILRNLYRDRVKLPLPSLDYFMAFFRSGTAKIFTVKHRDEVIGGCFCPVLPGHSVNTLYYCGERHYHRKIYPTHLAVLAAIEYGISHGIPLLDFMGAGKPGIEYGVRNYKKEFGGVQVEYGRFLKINQPALYCLGKFGLTVLSKCRP